MEKNMDKINILVADDDVEIVYIIRKILAEEGFNVLEAYNGEEALSLLSSQSVRLVILDIMMPKMNGLLATMKIGEKSNVPILILSAKGEESDRVIGLTTGADDYLVKPFMRAELVARVNSLLRRYMRLGSIAEVKPESVLAYHELELDTEAKRFSVRGSEVKLTPTELKIVTLLMKNPGRIFNAKEIYERVWDSDAYAAENTVMIHISRIRSKIEINPAKPEYIKVVWGIGYKLERE